MTHYDMLEVSQAASPEVIRAAWRSLMQRFHPDRNPGDRAAAARAAALTAAYEVLSDPQRRAAYDASLRLPPAAPAGAGGHAATSGAAAAAGSWQAAAVPRAGATRRAAQGARAPARRHVLAWPLLGLAAVGGAAWLARTGLGGRSVADPAAELAELRRQMDLPQTPESGRRELHGRKAALLAQHPALQRADAEERIAGMAARTFALLQTPLAVRLQPAGGGAAHLLTLPAASLLLGTFDADSLRADMERHRERLVAAVDKRLAAEDPGVLDGPDGGDRLRWVVRKAVMDSLGIEPGASYPSTWFESPGRYGVVDVLLPAHFVLERPAS